MRAIAAMLVAILTVIALSCGFAEEAFQEVDCSFAAGYYSGLGSNALLLADGTLCDVSGSGSQDSCTYKVYSDGERFILESSLGGLCCFVPQREKGTTDTGGVYYAVYSEYAGAFDEDFNEGRQVRFGDFVFGNDYDVFVREPLSVFFGVDGSASGYGKAEGPGYNSPEEAVSAYIRAFQKNDLAGMLSTFAVETFAEHFDLAKYVERTRAYNLGMGYIPSISDESIALNVEFRRSQIVSLIRYQYLTLTESACADGKAIIKDRDATGEQFLAENFATDDSPWLKEIDFQEEFLSPQTFSELYDSEMNQENIDLLIACYGGDEGRAIAARLEIAGKPYVQIMDTIRYGDRWYNLTLGGNLANLLALNAYSGGLSPYPIPED